MGCGGEPLVTYGLPVVSYARDLKYNETVHYGLAAVIGSCNQA